MRTKKLDLVLLGLWLVFGGQAYADDRPKVLSYADDDEHHTTQIAMSGDYIGDFIVVTSKQTNAYRDMLRVTCWARPGAPTPNWVRKPYEYRSGTLLISWSCKGRVGQGFLSVSFVDPDTGVWHRLEKINRCTGKNRMSYNSIWSIADDHRSARVITRCLDKTNVHIP